MTPVVLEVTGDGCEHPRIEVASFSSAPPHLQRRGLLGWLGVTIDGALQVDGIVLRRTRAGELALAFPERRDRAGRRHPVVRPLGEAARRAIEQQVFDGIWSSVRDGAAEDAGTGEVGDVCEVDPPSPASPARPTSPAPRTPEERVG